MDATYAVTSTIPGYEVAILLVYMLVGIGGPLLYLQRSAAQTDGERKRARSGVVIWFVACAFIHTVVELAFVFFRTTSSFRTAMNLYSAADLRYGTRIEAGTGSMETITGLIVGPFCLLTAYGIVKDTRWRHALQLCTSTCQMYGLAWFTLHPLFTTEQQVTHDPFLFVVVLIGMNAPWAIIPPVLWYESFKALSYGPSDRAFAKSNGSTNGSAAAPPSYRTDGLRNRKQ